MQQAIPRYGRGIQTNKEVDPLDTNWHRDGTPHVDYSTLIFAIAGHLDNGATPAPGPTSFAVNMETVLGDGVEPWEIEQEERKVDEYH